MKKLAARIIILSSSLFLLCALIYSISPVQLIQPKDDFIAAIIDKENLLKSINSPRIIFVGGSNLAFGIDSKKISDSLKIPVINNGVHAGLGLPFILNENKPFIKKNDIIIISMEYYLDNGSYDVIKHVTELDPEYKNFTVSNSLLFNIKGEIDIFIKRIFQKISRIQEIALYGIKQTATDSIYLRKSFSKEGDMIAHLDVIPPKNLKDRIELTQKDYNNNIILLNNFYAYSKAKKAKVYFVFPPYPISEYKKNAVAINYLEEQFKEKLKIPILQTPKEFTFPDDYFFDTVYHLNKKGREERTDKLISVLKKIITSKH